MSVLLRRARPGDLGAIMRLERDTFTDDAWPEDAMRRELASDHGFYLVAVDGEAEAEADAVPDAVFGYAGLLAPRGSGQGDIQTIAVEPGHRGTGLGRVLMQALIAEARRRDAVHVFLEVRADNPVARGLYASLGFTELGVRPRYYRNGVDAVLMRLEVPQPVTRPADARPAEDARPTDPIEETPS
ncbi:ribosomal protein S18-alanine N-acetyltransferase [Agromyces soli]|uniref:Ribosomal protein S18-alanine N-acetyltransferase n=1 Tax=Agromyces soli TaxID=659012 RepID=A0ABY4AN78_9MICO|nr:ribosomal protein S18-alanine N-acetyltransferase [Agromyces soli]UOE24612.1 ribosomal protein S18-alanine N-acetyltransferase [Agromyces soli]